MRLALEYRNVLFTEIPVPFERFTDGRAEPEVALLSVAKEPHQPRRIVSEDVLILGKDQVLSGIEAIEPFPAGGSTPRQKADDPLGALLFLKQPEGLHQGGAVHVEGAGVPVIIPHKRLESGATWIVGDSPSWWPRPPGDAR